MLRTVRMPITIIIPLLPVDAQDVDKPYLQTEQTHIEQKTAKDHHAQSRVDLFTIVDAQTNRLLPVSACFFFTKNGRRRCLNGTDSHPISIIFSEVDIIAIEVSSPGYQPYQGNLIVSELTGRSQQHIIRLVRELTLLSVRHNAANYHCELRRPNEKSPIPLTLVKGQPATFATYNVEPIPYTLVILDHTQTIREQRPITLTSGLNVVDVDHLPEATAGYAFNPDSLPPIYFEQSSFVLRSDAKTVLMQTTSYLNQHPALRLRITGHTDAEGDERLNQALSENRAKVVSSFLFAQGISDDRMILSGYGSRYPVAPNNSEITKIRNRRVQMKFENR
ncbi:MAG: OmpA family protein [Cytophagaceae bacterium]|nr:MAG: OmpA family protein [Cytophagaceae bacterium]